MIVRESLLAKKYYRMIEAFLIPTASRCRITPDNLTVIGFFIATAVPLGFYMHPLWGLGLIILSGISDSMDGLMARKNGMDSKFGAFLDSSLDRFSDFFYLFGFWVLFWDKDNPILPAAIVFMSMFFTQMISYLKARAEALGFPCSAGLMDRGLRTIYLMVWALALGVFPAVFDVVLWAGLIVYAAATLFTVIERTVDIGRRLKTEGF
jgi:phosphatidylglycerophosphate synthase